jgi:hypothetical protein
MASPRPLISLAICVAATYISTVGSQTNSHLGGGSRGIVYDESDEVELPPGQQSAVWKARADLGDLSCGKWDARRLSSHFYLVGFAC